MILFADGMPYDTNELLNDARTWDYCGGNATVESSGGRFGGRWIKHAYSYRNMPSMRKYLNGNYTTLIVQFGFWLGFINDDHWILVFRNADATECALKVQPGGFLQPYYNGTGTAGNLAPYPMLFETWNQIEIKVTFNSSTGSIDIRLNGASIISHTNIDTSSSGYDHCNILQFGHGNDFYVDTPCGFSDIIVMDDSGSYCNDFLGPRLVVPGLPMADGTYSQCTPSTGNNYECVDELPANNDTDYNESSGSNVRDTFVIPDLSDYDIISAVGCSIYAKEPSGGLISAKGVCRSSSSESESDEVRFSDNFKREDAVIYLDPNTSAPFTLAGFNAAEFGYKKVA